MRIARRDWLKRSASIGLSWTALQSGSAIAQIMESGYLKTLDEMIRPITQGAHLLQQDVRLDGPMLADNGSLVPLGVQVDSPMTPQNHVTHLYLLSQRNPVTQMALFQMGPWNGRAEIHTRLRLAGTQAVVALARLSNGEFRYGQSDIIITESACVDAS